MKRHEIREEQRKLQDKLSVLRQEQSRLSKAANEAEKALEGLTSSLEVETNGRLVEFISKHPEVIDVLAPEHTGTDCHDDSLHAVGRCPRCSLLVTKINGYVSDFTWEFTTKYSP